MSEGKEKVAVLAGGISSERQISIESGRCVADALRRGGYDVITADVAPDNLRILDDRSIDVFFICLHGRFGEDGRLQEILEERGVCYTHSNSAASRAAMDKMISKTIFNNCGLSTPKAIKFHDFIKAKQIQREVPSRTGKYIVKPINHGSSVGVDIVNSAGAAKTQCNINKSISSDYMIEEFIPGREITVGILNGRALPILEIRPKTGFYDYHAKYLDNNTEYLFDTVTDAELVERISRDALKCFDCLGCRGVARVDFILADPAPAAPRSAATSDGTAYALEINTVPGMTIHSCVPKAAARIGISMGELCGSIVRQAVADYQKRKDVALVEVGADGAKTKERQAVRQGI